MCADLRVQNKSNCPLAGRYSKMKVKIAFKQL